jgi:hypothetical protein
MAWRLLQHSRSLSESTADQIGERVDGFRLVRAARLDGNRATDACREQHDGDDIPRIRRAAIESKRRTASEFGGKLCNLGGGPSVNAEPIGYVDLSFLHRMASACLTSRIVQRVVLLPTFLNTIFFERFGLGRAAAVDRSGRYRDERCGS